MVDQGTTNVSHGCVNLPPEDAVTYYNLAVPGDPITVTASTAAGKWDDGWTEWFLTFSQYLKGSALGEAVEAGPQGSQFVSPARSRRTPPPPRWAPRRRATSSPTPRTWVNASGGAALEGPPRQWGVS